MNQAFWTEERVTGKLGEDSCKVVFKKRPGRCPNSFGISSIYDELFSEYDPASIELLVELAGRGPALELGIGTGRIAFPLYERGVAMQGIDASEAMVSKLRAKPCGAEIEVLMGSFAEFKMESGCFRSGCATPGLANSISWRRSRGFPCATVGVPGPGRRSPGKARSTFPFMHVRIRDERSPEETHFMYTQFKSARQILIIIILWSHRADGAILSTPVVESGKVYVSSRVVSVLDAIEGMVLWEFDPEILSTLGLPAIEAQGLYVASFDGQIFVLDKDDVTFLVVYNVGDEIGDWPESAGSRKWYDICCRQRRVSVNSEDNDRDKRTKNRAGFPGGDKWSFSLFR